MSHQQLKIAVVGGLGLMASPMARHWKPNGPVRVLRVHDRGIKDERRDRCRKAWRAHGSLLVPTFKELITEDLDGIFVCCGKNGDDLKIIASCVELLSKTNKKKFICHMSTVSTDFSEAGYTFCKQVHIDYVNYPLTGGSQGAEKGTLLILASGNVELYERLKSALSCLGTPRHFGEKISAGAQVKFMGHLMVFNGLMGIASAVATHAECFAHGKLGGHDQSEFFDFLNTGAGGTRQWDLVLSSGIRNDNWEIPFLLKYAVVDAIYTAKLCMDLHLSYLTVEAIINVALVFSYVLNEINPAIATQAIVREMIQNRATALDSFILKHSGPRGDVKKCLEKCIDSLPLDIQKSVALEIRLEDFRKAL